MRPRFLADANAGRLARWLRLLGYDTGFFQRGHDQELLRQARQEGRIVLTRDKGIPTTGDSPLVVLLESDDWRCQLAQVVGRFQLDSEQLLSRCGACNLEVEPGDPADLPARLAGKGQLWRCPGCQRVFWDGSHPGHVRSELESILGA